LANKQANCTKEYFKVKILKIEEMHKFEVAKIMHKASTNSLPYVLNSFFVKIDKIYKRSTRSQVAIKVN